MKYVSHHIPLVFAALLLAGCSTDDISGLVDLGKTPVSVAGGSPALTRATISAEKTDNEAKPFDGGTSLYIIMKSEKSDADALYTRTIGYAADKTTDEKSTVVNFNDTYGRFWEDSYSRNSQLSVYSVCVPSYALKESSPSETVSGTEDDTKWTVANSTTYDNTWSTGNGTTTIAWPLRSKSVSPQDATFLKSQDLCFSNNISKNGSTDNRITFNESMKKFGSGRMIFNHALTKVTFILKMGEGFTGKDQFSFTESGKNVVLSNFNTGGTFNFTTGEFETSTITTGTLSELSITTHDDAGYKLEGLIVPGTSLDDATEGDISFTIFNNLYKLSRKDLLYALQGKETATGTTALDNNKMRPGLDYVFTLTVGKKKMDKITASVVDWETVEADNVVPSNARIEVTLDDRGTKQTGTADFDLFRAADISSEISDTYTSYNWTTGYTDKAVLEENTTNSGIYVAKEASNTSENWYWPDNKTFYHFRTVSPKTTDSWKVNTETTTGDYITLTRAKTFTDVLWGAPFTTKDAGNINYSTSTGFAKNSSDGYQISKAIGVTNDKINMLMFHMMSKVSIQLQTVTGSDKVNLAGAKLTLKGLYPTGKVLLGTGLVEPTGTASDFEGTVDDSYKFTAGFIPQSLSANGKAELIITTADNNQYEVDLTALAASTVSTANIANPYTENSAGKYSLNAWYPGFGYSYTFTLKKTGISKITATVVDWESISADNQDVQIK
ncbi:MAG: fimbrillin family protein [Prevotella sp.]